MAILISQVKVDEVPDDRCPEIVSVSNSDLPPNYMLDDFDEQELAHRLKNEVCQPYNIEWFRPPTYEEIKSGDYEGYRNGKPLPKRERYVLYMSHEVQRQLGLLHETWSWLCCQYTDLSERNHTLKRALDLSMEQSAYKSRKLDWYLNAPWYKRIWRAMWLAK